MMQRLAAADVVFLGELHDDPEHHADQLKVLVDLTNAGRPRAVAMEQFDRGEQEALDRARRDRPHDARFVAEAAGFNFKGWNWNLYEPIIDRTLAAGLPLIAANLSRKEASDIVHGGTQSLSPERRVALALDRPLPPYAMDELHEAIAEGHCGQLPDDIVRGMVEAQRVRDAVISDTVMPYARRGVVVIAGRGHARRDYGAPFYIAARDPQLDIVSVGMFETDAHGRPNIERTEAEHAERGRPVFDFLWFAPAVTRGEPCPGSMAPGLLTPSQASARP
jgi:uncharacterized iron-regulated protein